MNEMQIAIEYARLQMNTAIELTKITIEKTNANIPKNEIMKLYNFFYKEVQKGMIND